MDILAVGDLNADIVVSGVDWPRTGVEALAEHGGIRLGGSAGIFAANAARLGLRVRLAAAVGEDALGDDLLRQLAAAGVDTAGVRRIRGGGTGFTMVINARGKTEKALLTWPGVLGQVNARQVRPWLQGARHLHCASYFLVTQLQKDLPALLARARTAGLTSSLDCNPDPLGSWDSGLAAALAAADWFFPNRAEAQGVTATRTLPAALRRLAEMTRAAVVKDGSRGVTYVSGGVQVRHPAAVLEAGQVVDTSGAGDSFDAGFLAARLRGADLHDALRFGQRCATLCCTQTGGTTVFEEPRLQKQLQKELAAIAQS